MILKKTRSRHYQHTFWHSKIKSNCTRECLKLLLFRMYVQENHGWQRESPDPPVLATVYRPRNTHTETQFLSYRARQRLTHAYIYICTWISMYEYITYISKYIYIYTCIYVFWIHVYTSKNRRIPILLSHILNFKDQIEMHKFSALQKVRKRESCMQERITGSCNN